MLVLGAILAVAGGPVPAAHATPSVASDVADATLAQMCDSLAAAWPDTSSATVPFDAVAIRAAFDPLLVPDPAPGLEPFASASVYDNGEPLDDAVSWDENGDGFLVVEYRGASGLDVCHKRVLVRRTYIDPFERGIVLFAEGDLLSGGGGVNPKITIEVPPPAGVTVAVHVGGVIESPEVVAAEIAALSGSPLTMEDVFPAARRDALLRAARLHGRSFASPAEALASPVDPVWSPQGGLSGLCVIEVPPGASTKLVASGVVNSPQSPGALLVPGGGELELAGTGDYYGVLFCEGTISTSLGTLTLHGAALSGADAELWGTVEITYNDLSVGNCLWPAGAEPISGSEVWLDTTPPVTTPSVADGTWSRDAIDVSFGAVDEFGGSGVDHTEYQLDGGEWVAGGSLSVTGEGPHVVAYRSVDRAANAEEAGTLTVGVDLTPPTVISSNDGLWHGSGYVMTLAAEDGGAGMSGGSAAVEFSRDGGLTWEPGDEVVFRTWKRGGGSGEHDLLYRATDAVGNRSGSTATTVRIDARPPVTSDDAPMGPQVGDTTVHFVAVDSRSGVYETRFSLDGGDWQVATSVTVPAADEGLHWIAYRSADNAGNLEYVKWCSVFVTGTEARSLVPRSRHRR